MVTGEVASGMASETAWWHVMGEHKAHSPQQSQGNKDMDGLVYGHFVHMASEGILVDIPKKTVLPVYSKREISLHR